MGQPYNPTLMGQPYAYGAQPRPTLMGLPPNPTLMGQPHNPTLMGQSAIPTLMGKPPNLTLMGQPHSHTLMGQNLNLIGQLQPHPYGAAPHPPVRTPSSRPSPSQWGSGAAVGLKMRRRTKEMCGAPIWGPGRTAPH